MPRTAARIYVPIDVAFLDDEKVIAAGERATYLYLAIVLRVKALDTDGVITRGQIARTGVSGWPQRLAKLVETGLLVSPDGHTFIVPAWPKWHELSHERAERHRRDRERKARGKPVTSANGSDSASNPTGILRHSALNAVSQRREEKPGNPPQPPPVKDVLRRIQNTPHGGGA